MIYFTSDTHFWHRAVIGYCNRPIPRTGDPVQTMNEVLIEKWNDKITGKDEVYFLGDLAFCGTTKILPILQQLNGTKYWIKGNHDYGLAKKAEIQKHFVWIRDYYLLRVHDQEQEEKTTNLTKTRQYHQPIVLCHFPILSWDGMAHGSWHLHGHSHGNLPSETNCRLDVGVDTNHLSPYSYQEVKEIMKDREFKAVDHHGQGKILV